MSAVGWDTPFLRRLKVDWSNNLTVATLPTTLSLGFTTSVLSQGAVVLPSPSIEATGAGYARTTLAWGSGLWNAADASGMATTKIDVTCFSVPSNWTVPALGWFIENPTTHDLWVAGALVDSLGAPLPMLPLAGQIVGFPAGSLSRQDAAA